MKNLSKGWAGKFIARFHGFMFLAQHLQDSRGKDYARLSNGMIVKMENLSEA